MAHRLIIRRSRRSLVAAAVAIATLFVSVAPFTTVAAPNPAVDAVEAVKWTVDKPTKTITVEVHLAFFTNAQIPDGRADTVSERIAFIKKAIMDVWDGRKFKCYTVRVKLVVRQVDKAGDVRNDEVPIELDAAIYPIGGADVLEVGKNKQNAVIRSYVQSGSGTDEYLSEDPSSTHHPVTGPQEQHSSWHMFESGTTYAHEFGHILGLGDSYVDVKTKDGKTKSVNRPGAVDDMMSTGYGIDATTMTRVIRRAGIDDKQLPCPMTWDLPDTHIYTFFEDIHLSIHAWTCDYDPASNAPGAKPLITFQGVLTVKGAHKDPILGSASAGGVEQFTTTYPVGDPVLRAVLSTGLVVSQGVEYWRDGLRATRPVALISSAGPLQLDTRSEFTLEAKECPP